MLRVNSEHMHKSIPFEVGDTSEFTKQTLFLLGLKLLGRQNLELK